LQPRYGYFTDMDTADRVPFVQRFAREGAAAAVAARLSGSATERFLQVGPCPNLFEASQFRHVIAQLLVVRALLRLQLF
jgi:hypothetical protein